LILGGALLVAFVGIGAALPRPQAEFSLAFARAPSRDVSASKFAVSRGEPGKGKGRPGAQQHDPKGDREVNNGRGREGKGDKGKDQSSDAKATEKDAAKDSGASGKDDGKSSDQKAASDPESGR